jgi:hypothetical protein
MGPAFTGTSRDPLRENHIRQQTRPCHSHAIGNSAVFK